MRDQHFTQTFPLILEPIWSLVLRSQVRIEHVGRAAEGQAKGAVSIKNSQNYISRKFNDLNPNDQLANSQISQ